jgi:hypothetical protein
MESFWAILGGAVFGSIVTALATWRVSVRLNRENEARRIRAASWVVQLELEECQDKLNEARVAGLDLEGLKGRLLLGDWLELKGTLAVIAIQDEQLWRDVAAVYRKMSEFNNSSDRPPPTDDELTAIINRLVATRDRLGKRNWLMRFIPLG